ncbi:MULTISPECIES: phosphoribosylformylglycinamidine cyclo-ligase [Cytobacillus]|uniref:phosphoribosylformylglycinamidine cyclo-ligase n=1 Tax=Cytobacillus TaxID=2675230 RepID=UPI001CD1ECA7|nr:phosphoribosylformylglycinamidine cyclo-ligase [Cytobacillus kochii]MCA1029029.1 phosphoribosylformylglycinamidine cyclo-ligase [Cytobacillus kochii]MCM3324456.1 phosphoribosylformylglycinamidine cyclo-ligase [Cytobacillus kochii]MCM3346849.1 phosphoribosylformylglycinamidine cyclo-ligase [Cytobacillus kochii]MDM5205996.1 phosphoribosylformylglycinamidine cyclo-ligase [Cytobacillus kochii]
MANAYKQAGVDIEAGYEAVNRMKKHVEKTMRPGVIGGLGGFGGMFDLSSLGLKEPVLVSGTDGVGTKLMLAFMMNQHDTIGIDAVAMCVNDIVVQGAEPLYFLDYIACGKAEPEKIEAIVKGIADGCEQAGCALVGGETAEMPGMYSEEEYDLAGFSVGACEKSDLIDGSNIQEGDVLIGLASNGIHSNGYSLVRKIFLEDAKLSLQEFREELGSTLGEELLKPTRIYVKSVLSALKQFDVKGFAHITGGGFIENIPRVLPQGLGAELIEGSWEIQPIFKLMEEVGKLARKDMYNIFNMGIGMVAIVPVKDAEKVVNHFNQIGEKASVIGKVTQQEGISIL